MSKFIIHNSDMNYKNKTEKDEKLGELTLI